MTHPDLSILLFDFAPSGVVRNALRVAAAAHAAGLKTEIWAAQDYGEMRGDLAAEISVHGLGLEVGGGYSRAVRKRAAMSALGPLVALLSDRRPAILLSAGNHIHPLAVAGYKAADARETRLIGRISNELPRFDPSSPLKLGPSIFKRLRARQRLAAMHRLVSVSEVLRQDLIHRLRIDPIRISTIPNGISLEQARSLGAAPLRHRWFEPGEPPVVVSVGRLVPQKDFQTLLRAFALARQSLPMRLMILGSGPLRENLAQLAARLRIAPDVAFVGHVTNPFSFLSRASLFVLPSRWEGMSNALLEALACGCPAVATSCAGSVEILGNGRWGALVPIGDAHRMSESILSTLAAPPSPERQIERATHYDLQRSMARYVDLFMQECGGQPQATERAPRIALDVQSRNSSSNIGWAKT